jgi:hypothetical protein
MARTGRLFKCLSLKGEESEQVAEWFTIGKVYEECDLDLLGQNDCDVTTLLMYTDLQVPVMDQDMSMKLFTPQFYVSTMDFELVDGVMAICQN